jgi:hypothetical protein
LQGGYGVVQKAERGAYDEPLAYVRHSTNAKAVSRVFGESELAG